MGKCGVPCVSMTLREIRVQSMQFSCSLGIGAYGLCRRDNAPVLSTTTPLLCHTVHDLKFWTLPECNWQKRPLATSLGRIREAPDR